MSFDRAARYRKLKAQGICTLCGRNPAQPDRTRCHICAARQKLYYTKPDVKERRSKEWINLTKQQKEHHNAQKTVRRRKQRERIIAAYGGQCACCGESLPEFLTVDHIDGGGNQHRRSLSRSSDSGYRIYGWLERNNYPEGFQILCWNCNLAKGIYGQCPHQSLGI